MANPFEKVIAVVEHLTENFGVFNAGFSKETAKTYLDEAKREIALFFNADKKIVEQQVDAAVDHNNDANTPPTNIPPTEGGAE